jgi:putative peptidoglycan lipid II flippase
LFDKGNITNTDLIKISTLIKLYALSLIAIFLYLLFGLILLSVNKNKVYALYGMLAQLVMMLINIIGYREWGIYTFVVSLTFSHLFAAIILFYKLPFPKLGIAADIFKYGFLIVLTTVSVFLIKHFLYNPTNYYAAIAYNSFIVVLCGFVFAIFLKIEELKSLQIPFRHINKK